MTDPTPTPERPESNPDLLNALLRSLERAPAPTLDELLTEEAARPRLDLGGERPTCPTLCDADCTADCHEAHQVPSHRAHSPASCRGTLTAQRDAARATAVLPARAALADTTEGGEKP